MKLLIESRSGVDWIDERGYKIYQIGPAYRYMLGWSLNRVLAYVYCYGWTIKPDDEQLISEIINER